MIVPSLTLACLSLAALPCRIQILDAENGWPVPMVELTTTHNVSFWTDNAGVAAFDLPELMGRETWLSVSSDGYEAEADGFGYRGFRFTPKPNGRFTFKVKRTSIAKRLGRIAGAGIFGESQKLGERLDWKESGVLGSDSIQAASHKGMRYWLWGDTALAGYPLGLFHASSATLPLKPITRFQPPIALNLTYISDEKGQPRNVADLFPKDPGPTWLGGTVSLKDASGRRRLVAAWTKIEPPMNAYRIGLCEWDEASLSYRSIKTLWDKKDGGPEPSLIPMGHPILWKDSEEKEWLLFGDPFPSIKMPATYEAWRDPSKWSKVETPEFVLSIQNQQVKPHRGSIAWNSYRKRWVAIFCEMGGKPSPLGEIWYCESHLPLGPWGRAVKVLSHQKHTFYNPLIHQDLTPEGSPILLFEGTYSQMFSASPTKTPRHDYNQILYRLDLDDPRLRFSRGSSEGSS